MTRLKIVKF